MKVKLYFFRKCLVILFIIYIFALSKITHSTEYNFELCIKELNIR